MLGHLVKCKCLLIKFRVIEGKQDYGRAQISYKDLVELTGVCASQWEPNGKRTFGEPLPL